MFTSRVTVVICSFGCKVSSNLTCLCSGILSSFNHYIYSLMLPILIKLTIGALSGIWILDFCHVLHTFESTYGFDLFFFPACLISVESSWGTAFCWSKTFLKGWNYWNQYSSISWVLLYPKNIRLPSWRKWVIEDRNLEEAQKDDPSVPDPGNQSSNRGIETNLEDHDDAENGEDGNLDESQRDNSSATGAVASASASRNQNDSQGSKKDNQKGNKKSKNKKGGRKKR